MFGVPAIIKTRDVITDLAEIPTNIQAVFSSSNAEIPTNILAVFSAEIAAIPTNIQAIIL